MVKTTNPRTDGVIGEFMDLEQEDMSSRLVEVETKNGKIQKFTVVQDGQFALWRVVPSKGPVPLELDGRYTSVAQAEQAIQTYVSNRDGK